MSKNPNEIWRYRNDILDLLTGENNLSTLSYTLEWMNGREETVSWTERNRSMLHKLNPSFLKC
jgi:hypothetical protein